MLDGINAILVVDAEDESCFLRSGCHGGQGQSGVDGTGEDLLSPDGERWVVRILPESLAPIVCLLE